ncbi:MAG: hypothetical protein EON60_02755 [Alphaproteobacteria bacterium]|nr:MAG: hypothetical protein EON60_02755 [Alphaproteobacteria bacterium]
MTMEYEDMVRNITQTYWRTLIETDGPARQEAAALMQRYGLQPAAANTIIDEFSLKPWQEWTGVQLEPKSGA